MTISGNKKVPMTAPADDRIRELREYALDQNLPPDFMDLLDAYAALKVENERLKKNAVVELQKIVMSDPGVKVLEARAEKAEADLRDQVIADGYSVAALQAENKAMRDVLNTLGVKVVK